MRNSTAESFALGSGWTMDYGVASGRVMARVAGEVLREDGLGTAPRAHI